MGDFLQYATMAGITLEAGLLARSLHRREEKVRPYFLVFLFVLLVTSAFEFVIFYTRAFADANNRSLVWQAVYWKVAALESAVGFLAIAEQLQCGGVGLFGGVALGTLLWLLPGIAAVAVVTWSLVILAAVAWFWGESRLLASGFLVFYLSAAILYIPAVPFWARGIPVFAWVFALLLWFYLPPLDSRANL